jgi:hypothetical protein
MADTAVKAGNRPVALMGGNSRARLAFVSPRIITAIIDRASVVSLREAEAKDRVNKD